MGVVTAAGGGEYSRGLAWRESARALLIADEVITGCRVARGGGQELSGLDPDLSEGQDQSAGPAAAAYGGRRGIHGEIAPAGDVYQDGTLSREPSRSAAGSRPWRSGDDAYVRLAEALKGPQRRPA